MGELFGIGQSQANEWIHVLLPILRETLDALGYEPERDPQKFKEHEQDRKDMANSVIEARKGAVRGQNRLKNRCCTTVARRRPIATRT